MTRNVEEVVKAIENYHDYYGENAVEYAGYGYCKDFMKFCLDKIGVKDRADLLESVDKVYAYLDVVNDLMGEELIDEEDTSLYTNPLHGTDISMTAVYNNLEYMLVAGFLLSDFCPDKCYTETLERLVIPDEEESDD